MDIDLYLFLGRILIAHGTKEILMYFAILLLILVTQSNQTFRGLVLGKFNLMMFVSWVMTTYVILAEMLFVTAFYRIV